MATFIQNTVRRLFKNAVPVDWYSHDWYSHDAQKRFYHEMGELRKEFYRQGR